MKISKLLKEIDHALWVLEEHDKHHFGVNHNAVAEAQAARVSLAELRSLLKTCRKVSVHGRPVGGSEFIVESEAVFHQFGIDFFEFESGPGQLTTAVVELPDGRCLNFPLNTVRFFDAAQGEEKTP